MNRQPNISVPRPTGDSTTDTPSDSDSDIDDLILDPKLARSLASGITVPRETILLPSSAKDRLVQFFPKPSADAKHILIIGSKGGDGPSPPIGAYFTDQDLGPWVELSEAEVTTTEAAKLRVGGKMENFVAEDDCILEQFQYY